MLSRAQLYRDQAALALQRGYETRDPTLRSGFDDLGREWLRLAEQAEWIENQQRPPLANEPPDGIEPDDFAPAVFRCSPKEKTLTPGEGARVSNHWMGSWGLGAGRPSSCTNNPAVLPVFRVRWESYGFRCPRRSAIYSEICCRIRVPCRPCLPTKARRSRPPARRGCVKSSSTMASGFIARKDGARVKLYSRPGNNLTDRFSLIVEALAGLRSRSCIIDGEAGGL
jgi:hypothetical protein